MYRLKGLFCAVICIFALSACSENKRSEQSIQSSVSIDDSDQMATVYYFDFNAQRITGIPESQIEQYSCKYYISKASFLKLLYQHEQNASLKADYSPLDIRAKVILDGNKVYFINQDGVMRYGNQFFLLNKTDFLKHLKLQERCKYPNNINI